MKKVLHHRAYSVIIKEILLFRRETVMQRLWVTVLSLLLLLLTACSGSSNGSETTETDVTTVFESETFAVSDTVGDADSVPQEMRGVWVATVTNLNYPSRRGLSADALAAELDAILSVVSSSGFNTVFFLSFFRASYA